MSTHSIPKLIAGAFMLLPVLTADIAVAQEQGQPELASAEEAIIASERSALDRWSSGDPLGYLDVMADDVTYMDDIGAAQGIRGKDAMKDYLGSLVGMVRPHEYELINPKVQLYGDVGILTLHYQGTGEDGTALPLWKASVVYRLIDGDWKIVHANWSLVKAGPEPAE